MGFNSGFKGLTTINFALRYWWCLPVLSGCKFFL